MADRYFAFWPTAKGLLPASISTSAPWEPDTKPCIVCDASRTAPPAFGLKVAAKRTYIPRRKARGKSLMSKVGNAADFRDLNLAREKAAEPARQITETGANPIAEARAASVADLILGVACARYREHLAGRTLRPQPQALQQGAILLAHAFQH